MQVSRKHSFVPSQTILMESPKGREARISGPDEQGGSDSSSIHVPAAVYRLQFNRNFTFRDAREILPYLHDLGITHVYASPLIQSRRGSGHGYDTTDPTHVDPELGTEKDFEMLQAELRRLEMGLILDIVPNHMAAEKENPWWMDVLENGPSSAYASFFDIDWHPPSRVLDNKVLLPVLGRPYGETLESRELRLAFKPGRFLVKYYDSLFPVNPKSYRLILKHRLDVLESALGTGSVAYQEYQGVLASLSSLLERESRAVAAAGERRLQIEAVKERLQHLCKMHPEVRDFIAENVRLFNGRKGDASSFRLLDRLLAEQSYVLAYWQNVNQGINYRRFFTISDLVGVRVEDPVVFEATHDVILELAEKGIVNGLRIDHIDGLRDPAGYLRRLQERLGGATPGFAPRGGFYIVVEKILSDAEELPKDWPVEGTTGYDFLNRLTRLFTLPRAAKAIERVYADFLGETLPYEEVAYRKKKLVMATLLAVEMRALSGQLALVAEQDRYARDLPQVELGQALIETTASFPVYRTYIRGPESTSAERRSIETAVEAARRRRLNIDPACFDFVLDVLLLRDQSRLFPDQREARLAFVMRWQQFTGPIMAKGLEDTVMYVYNPLICLNEVGGDPRPSASRIDFHRFIHRRARSWPYSFNATSTHDAKRAEDVRARISVLSELPAEWRHRLGRWARLNASKKRRVKGKLVPDPNEEIFLYQTLLGAWPIDPQETSRLVPRLHAYAVKAVREAMVHTRWTRPNLEHERALTGFIDRILEPGRENPFLDDFLKFERKIAGYGMLNGLAQVLLKIACPGVPDFYQGSELWDLRLVDPDNRRPVDFKRRETLLKSVQRDAGHDTLDFLQELVAKGHDGRIKLYVIWKALDFRRKNRGLLMEGSYSALEADGRRAGNIFAFVRRYQRRWMMAVVPRWLGSTRVSLEAIRAGACWGSTQVLLPRRAPVRWTNVLTGESMNCWRARGQYVMPVRRLLCPLPVALLSAVQESGMPGANPARS